MSGPEPIAHGDLASTPLAHVLLHLRRGALEGTLCVWPGTDALRGQDRIRVSQGWPTAGRFLTPASSLERGLFDLFGRSAAPWAFYDADLVGDGQEVLRGRVDCLALVTASLRAYPREEAIEGVLQRLGPSMLRLSRGFEVEVLRLQPNEAAFVELLRAEPSDAERLVETFGDRKIARRILYLLAIARAIEVIDAASVASPMPAAAPTTEPLPTPRVSEPQPRATADDEFAHAARDLRARKRVPPEPPPPPPPGLPPALQDRWLEIADRVRSMDEQDFFQMLGIARSAGTQAARDAYLEAVKTWHPDRIPAELLALRPIVEKVFLQLTEARDTLTDEEARTKYIRVTQEGGGTPAAQRRLTNIINAAMEFRKVELLVKRRDWERALELLDAIMELNPEESDYFAMRAQILHHRYSGPTAPLEEMLATVDRALELAKDSELAHFTKGLVLKRMKREYDALDHFRRAADLNPRNIDAVREVRLAQMRGQRTRRSSSPGARPSSRPGSGSNRPGRKSSRPPQPEGLLSRIFGQTPPNKKK